MPGSGCWSVLWKMSTRECWRFWPMANRGRVRRLPLRSGRVNEPCSVRFIRWKSSEKSALSGMFAARRYGGAAHDRIHDDIVTPGSTPTDLGASDEDCRD